jgi:hypothetical protein
MRRRRLWWLWVSWVLAVKQVVLPWPSSSSVSGSSWQLVVVQCGSNKERVREEDRLALQNNVVSQSVSQPVQAGESQVMSNQEGVSEDWLYHVVCRMS